MKFSSHACRRKEEDDGSFLTPGLCFVTVNKELGSSRLLLGQCNMRSLIGLIFVIVAATFYLYSLSLYLPPGPRRHVSRAAKGEHVDTGQPEQPADSSGDPIG